MIYRTKGRILAVIQFTLLFLIAVFAFIENTFLERNYSSFIYIISLILLVSGLASAVFTLTEFKQYMTPNPVPLDNAQLRTGGIYSVVRHPMYLSVILLIIGGTLFLRAYCTLVFDAAAIIFLLFKIGFEEKMLCEKYPEYPAYRMKTKKIIPFIY